MLARNRTPEGWQVEASGLWPIVCLCGDRENDCGVHGPMHMSWHDAVPGKHGKGTRTQSVSCIQHPSRCLDYKMKMQAVSGNTSPASPSSSIEDGHLPSVTLYVLPQHVQTYKLCASHFFCRECPSHAPSPSLHLSTPSPGAKHVLLKFWNQLQEHCSEGVHPSFSPSRMMQSVLFQCFINICITACIALSYTESHAQIT